jgi:hypothetical protein
MGDAVTEPAPDQNADQQPADTAPAADDAIAKATAEAEKWKALARKHEESAKTNRDAAKRLAEFEAANQSDLEKAVNAARAEGLAEATARPTPGSSLPRPGLSLRRRSSATRPPPCACSTCPTSL